MRSYIFTDSERRRLRLWLEAGEEGTTRQIFVDVRWNLNRITNDVRLLRKMMDTRDFSTFRLAKQEDGKIVKMRTGLVPLKSNVFPVFVIPTVRKRNILAGDRVMNFAEYVTG